MAIAAARTPLANLFMIFCPNVLDCTIHRRRQLLQQMRPPASSSGRAGGRWTALFLPRFSRQAKLCLRPRWDSDCQCHRQDGGRCWFVHIIVPFISRGWKPSARIFPRRMTMESHVSECNFTAQRTAWRGHGRRRATARCTVVRTCSSRRLCDWSLNSVEAMTMFANRGNHCYTNRRLR
jgi:hypothetical protein